MLFPPEDGGSYVRCSFPFLYNRTDRDCGVEQRQLVRLITDLTFTSEAVYFAYDLLTIPVQKGVKTAKITTKKNNQIVHGKRMGSKS